MQNVKTHPMSRSLFALIGSELEILFPRLGPFLNPLELTDLTSVDLR